MEPSKACAGTHGPRQESPFHRHFVPLRLFLEDPNNPNSKEFKTCLHCRQYDRKRNKDKEQIRKNKHMEIKNQLASGIAITFGYCTEPHHGGSFKSEYPKDKVPIHLFRKIPENPNSEIFSICLDCRKQKRIKNKKHIIAKTIEANKAGKILCVTCSKEITVNNKSYNKDGNLNKVCFSCQSRAAERTEYLRNLYKTIILEFIVKHQASCQKCFKLYFVPDDGTTISKGFETYSKDDGYRYLKGLDNKEYKVIDVLNYMPYNLELSVIELDHLTEYEQRERKLLSDNEVFVPKYKPVSQLRSEHKMRFEAKKCQHLCIKCHIEVTISREKGVPETQRSIHEREKMKYVNELKSKGCSNCGYVNLNLLRFFDLDHTDPELKTETITIMVRDNKYSLHDVIAESQKCTVMCKMCHRLKTNREITSRSH